MCDARVSGVLVAVLCIQVACDAPQSQRIVSPDAGPESQRTVSPDEVDIILVEEGRSLADNANPFTVESSNVPEAHDGECFGFRIDFSDPVAISYRDMRDHAFNARGRITKAKRLNRSRQYIRGRWRMVASAWRISVDPYGPVALELPIRSCDEEGAVCSLHGRPLSEGLELSVPGPGIAISVNDVTVEEDSLEAEFTVSITGYGDTKVGTWYPLTTVRPPVGWKTPRPMARTMWVKGAR